MVPRVTQGVRGRRVLGCARMAWVVPVLAGVILGLAPTVRSDEEGGAEGQAHAWRSAGKQGLTVRGLSCLRVHPRNPSVLWAHVHDLGLARSEDGGRTWQPRMKGIDERELPGRNSQVRVSLDPRDVKTMYVVIDGHVYRSENGGDSWRSITSGALSSLSWDRLRNKHLGWEVRVDSKKGIHLLLGTRTDGEHNGGLYESDDGGKSWEQIAGSARADSGLGNDTWIVRMSPKTDKEVLVAGRTAVWFSGNRGRQFERVDPGGKGLRDVRWLSNLISGSREAFLADARGIWRSRDSGKRWDKEPLIAGDARYVAVDPHNKRRVYAVFGDTGLWLSEDTKHAKWTAMGGAFGADPDAPRDAGAGYRGAEIGEVYPHPREKKTVYLTSPATGLHVSTDDGETFAAVTPPEDAKPEEIIPERMPRLAVVGAHPATDGAHLAVNEFGMVYRSADRGETWEHVGRLGMEPGLLEPDAVEHTWWAAGRRLLRSTDDGATWEVVYEPNDAEERIVALQRGSTEAAGVGTLRLLLERSGVVVTRKAGEESWVEGKAPRFPEQSRTTAFAEAETWATGLGVDPSNGDHLLMATRTTSQVWSVRDPNGGVYESWDGGKTWTDVTGGMRVGPGDPAAAQKTKARWNRGRLGLVDPSAALLVYGADGRGILARPWVDPEGDEPEAQPPWLDVTPAKAVGGRISAFLHTMTPDLTDTRLVVQFVLPDGETALFGIAGRTLRALWQYQSMKPKPKDPPPAWTALPSPGARVVLGSLAADAQLPGRLLATDARSDFGVLVYEVPGSKPAVKDENGEEPGEDGETQVPPKPTPPEGMRAFTAGADNSLRIWRVDTGEATHNLEEHEGQVLCVGLSPDEQYVLTGGADKKLNVWNASSAKLVASMPMEANVNAIAFDADGTYAYLALEEKQQVVQLELATRKLRPFEGHSGGVLALATSEDVNRVYSGARDQTIRVWDTKEAAEVLQIPMGGRVVALAVAQDGSRIYAAAADNTVKAFDAAGEEVGALGGLGQPASGLALSPDGGTLYVARVGGVLAVPTDTMQGGTLHSAEQKAVICVTVSADGQWILAGDAEGGLWLWARGETGAFWSRGKAHESAVLGVTLTPDETEAPGEGSGDAPPDKPGAAPPDKPGDAPPDKPGAAPPERPGDAPPEKPGDAPPEKPAVPDNPK